jgi:two-component system NtrC family sensor kinase
MIHNNLHEIACREKCMAEADRTGAHTPNHDSSHIAQAVQKVQQSLLERPSLTIRMRIISCFVLLTVVMCGSTLIALLFLSRFEAKVQFLEKLTEYSFEVQQARRFEKNFFLYGTNLQDALENVQAASDHLARNAEDVKRVAGDRAYRTMEENLGAYQETLEEVLRISGGSKIEPTPAAQRLELQLRRLGYTLIADTGSLLERERVALNEMLRSSFLAVIGFFTFMFIAMALVATLLIQAVLAPLKRFEQYTGRIAAGDYSLIVPARKYRDEFSQLALAINNMLQELELRQQQLMQSAKMAAVGSLTSGIAHELNNPLNNIGLVTEDLSQNFSEHSDEEKLQMLSQIETQVERASSTVRNLLDFTRSDKPVFTNVSVNEVIRDTARLLGNEMKLSGVELSVIINADLPVVIGNPRNIQQVFLNIMLNAIQAMPSGGRLTVKGYTEQDFLRVDIEDTGEGIAGENLDRVFDPFFTTKDPGIGTGLGLAVSYSIMEAHKGKISVESYVGQGTTFSVFLPLRHSHK